MALLLFLSLLYSDTGFFNPLVRGTVWIRAGDKSVGTGWVVDRERRWIITARHVVADRERVDAVFVDRGKGRVILERDHYLRNQDDLRKRGRMVAGTVIAKRDESDLALIQLDALPTDACEIRLSEREMKPGDACFAIGHRHDAETLWNQTTGSIRQIGTLSQGYFWAGKKIGADVPIAIAQLPIESGESGSALFNSRGEAIGLISAVSNRSPGAAFAIALPPIRKLLSEARGNPKLENSTQRVDSRPDVGVLSNSAAWVRPRATDGRFAGVVIDRKRGLLLTTANAAGGEPIVDVVFPRRDGGRIIAEAAAYGDLLGLQMSKRCVQGVVLARDPVRDLALIELDRVPDGVEEARLGPAPRMGDRVALMSHPVGEEMLWLYASGTVRSLGKATLRRDGGDESAKVGVALLQLPHQGTSSGGPIVNMNGELIGIAASREGSRQELAYAAIPDEIHAFLKSVPIAYPRDAAAWLERARFMERSVRAEKALEAYQEAAALEPRNPLFACEVVRAYFRSGRLESAKPATARLVDLPNRTEESEIVRAECLWMNQQADAAKAIVEAVLRTNPKSAPAWLLRAYLTVSMEAVQKAIELDLSQPRAYALRAGMARREDGKQRLADWSRAIELQPANAAFVRVRAKLLDEMSEFKKSANDRQRVAELLPLKAESWLELGQARFRQGDRAAAAKAFANAYRVDPKGVAQVSRTIVEFGANLQADDPNNFERVADWLGMNVQELMPFVPDAIRKGWQAKLKTLAEADAKTRVWEFERMLKNLR